MGELVGVHGIAQQQRGRQQLLAAWTPALADGLERAADRPVEPPPLDLAFYGDVFLPDRDGPAIMSANAESVFDGMDEQELAEVGEAMTDVVTAEDIEAAERQVTMSFGRAPRPVQVLLRAVDRRFGAAAGVLYVGVLRQVYRYLHDPDLKLRVDDRVENACERCRVLIGHSLGSVVAYEYLRQNPGRGIELFLTLGSPLGLRMVRSRLQVAPVNVPGWVTVRDLRDPVACAGELRRCWPQIREGDELVVDNGDEAHAIERYLSKKATGQVLLRALPHLAKA
jgi:hypothetical protein